MARRRQGRLGRGLLGGGGSVRSLQLRLADAGPRMHEAVLRARFARDLQRGLALHIIDATIAGGENGHFGWELKDT